MRSYAIFRFIFLFLGLEIVFSQIFINKSFDQDLQKIIFDTGQNWSQLSSISSLRDHDLNNFNTDTLYLKKGIGYIQHNSHKLFYLTGRFIFKKHFFAYYDSQFLNNRTNYSSQLGISNSGVGYRNDWLYLQLGKGRENWGSGSYINLALSDNSAPYNYFKLASNYGKIRVNYIHGFLEKTSNGINRYLNARAIEWTNKKSAIISLSEIIIYSGYNRSFDFSYINPLASHLEIELNNRLNNLGNDNSNAVWQIHFDFRIKNRSRFSVNYLLDEFVFDPNIEINKEHGKAYSLKYVYSLFLHKNNVINFFISKIYVGTPTFRHLSGTNNFVNQNKPLGWIYGSDGEEIKLGASFLRSKKMFGECFIGFLDVGEESIQYRALEPYKNYLKEPFPSGNVKKTLILRSKIQQRLSNNFSYGINLGLIENISTKAHELDLSINFLFYI